MSLSDATQVVRWDRVVGRLLDTGLS